ncbi:MAG: hypothetical protein JWO58_488 [Chitinophagaceae bacterium]|nr:hypothetical protein [Chitinophagaceae bacterium]
MKTKLTILLLAFLLKAHTSDAQIDSVARKQQFERYHETPVWMDMMNDPNANYNETCRAFAIYWLGREIPAESEGEANELYAKSDKKEKEGKSEREREREREREKKNGTYKKEEHEEEEGLHFKDPNSYAMVYAYKRFINWKQTMRDKVDPETGKFLSTEQQEAIWKNQTQGIDTHIK